MTPPPDNSDPRDYVLDLSSTPPADAAAPSAATRADFLSIHFKCCGIYAPIYRNAAATAYAGHCPRCRRPTRIAITPHGDPGRIFTAQ